MATRGTLYRCNLFSFAGPQTRGVESHWTQGLVPIGERDVRSGEPVELYVKIDVSQQTVSSAPHIRFDVLEEDFLLTGGLDDRVVTLLGTDTPPPDDDFSVRPRISISAEIPVGETIEEAVERFKVRNADSYANHLLVYTDSGSSPGVVHLITWWIAERVEDWANAELYFIVNVDGEFEDQSDVISVSPERFVPPPILPDVSWPELQGISWEDDSAAPGDLVSFEIEGRGLQPGIHVGVTLADEVGDIVDQFDVPILRGPRHLGYWRVPANPGELYHLRAELAGRELSTRRPLSIKRTFKFRLDVPFARGVDDSLSPVAYRVLDQNGVVVREGTTSLGREVELPDLPGSDLELELEGVEIISVSDAPVATPPDVPPAIGRFFRIVELGKET